MERKRSGATFPVWIGQVTSFQLLLETNMPVSQQHPISESRIGHWAHPISVSWWILNFSRFTLCSGAPLRACLQQVQFGFVVPINAALLEVTRVLIALGCGIWSCRTVKNNKLKCAHIRALVTACVLLLLLQCWGVMEMNFLYKPWLPFLLKLAIFYG